MRHVQFIKNIHQASLIFVITIVLTLLMLPMQAVFAEGGLRYVQPEGLWPSAQYQFSQVVTSTGTKTIYLSGQTARDKDGHVVGGDDLEKQMVQALKNVKTGLAAAKIGLAGEVSGT